ncbi:transcriptional corepressor LEUNIG_HOMOLOG-like [Nymphaea colorata]|nr:transcriptional corepressor LEUNIG_HOMOLOG-like [Nymphaea colorata]
MAGTDMSKILDAYILDYMMKKNLHASASTFMKEGKVPKRSAVDVIDAPAGFLLEWWSVFWDIFLARTNAKCSDAAASYLKQLKEKDKQIQCDIPNLQMMHELRQQQTPDMCSSPFIVCSGPGIPEHISRQPAASTRLYAELPRHGYAQQLDCSAYLDASQKLVTDHSRDVAQVSRRNLSMASGGLYLPPSQASSNIGDTNLAKNDKTGSLDPALCGIPADMQSRSRPLTDMSPGIKPLPLNGGPLMGSDHFQLHSAWVSPMQRPDRLQQSQLLMHLQQRQQLTDAPENCRSMFTANCSQPGKGSPIQLPSQLIGAVSDNQAVYRPVGQQVRQDQGPPLENCRKRKKSENLGTAKSAGMDDFTGASFTSALSSGHRKSAGNASGHSGMSRKNQPHVSVGMRGNTHPLEQLENLDNCHAATSLEDDVDSFLSHDYENAVDSLVGTSKRNSDPLNVDSLSEVACLRSSNSKVVCCSFSSDGKLLASAGHDKKVLLWNMDTLETKSLPDVHALLITDVRFRPNSTYLATSSFDRTLRLWNAAEPLHSVGSLSGHMTQVMSLDFHPTNEDLLCSCDANGEIRFWSVKDSTTHCILKGGASKVRFQPGSGHFFAAGADNVVNVFDVESHICESSLKGHGKDVRSICWNWDGKVLASVSEDCVRVWPMTAKRGESTHKLRSNGNKFQSCVFHPAHTHVLVVSGYQSIELWDLVADRVTTVAAHDGIIAGLAQSPVTGMIATASHDKCVKLWK